MADSVSVFGGRAPAEVEQLAKHLRTLDRDTFSQMLSGQSDHSGPRQTCCLLCLILGI